MATPRMKELMESITSLLPSNTEGIKDDFKDNLKILLNDYLKKINGHIENKIEGNFDFIKNNLTKNYNFNSFSIYDLKYVSSNIM